MQRKKNKATAKIISRGKNSGVDSGLHNQGFHITDQSNTAEVNSGIRLLVIHCCTQQEGYLWENTKSP